jgi:hypothetical protein
VIYRIRVFTEALAHGPKSTLAQLPIIRDAEQPFGGLALSAEKSETGRFELIAGFPLESFNPAPAATLLPSRAISMDELSVDSRTDEPHR